MIELPLTVFCFIYAMAFYCFLGAALMKCNEIHEEIWAVQADKWYNETHDDEQQ